MDTDRVYQPATVGVLEIDNDNLHGGGIGGADGAIEHVARPVANRAVRGVAVYIGIEATRLRDVASIYGDIFRNGDSVRDAVAFVYGDSLRGGSVNAGVVAIFKGLSKDEDNGISRPER